MAISFEKSIKQPSERCKMPFSQLAKGIIITCIYKAVNELKVTIALILSLVYGWVLAQLLLSLFLLLLHQHHLHRRLTCSCSSIY